MTLRYYQIFVTVCDERNMTAAAGALFMSQPAVSQAIAELEKHYGVRLFERLSRKLFLTEAGEKLLSYARHMLRMNAQIDLDMKSLREHGTLRIGASVTIGAHILPRLVTKFQRAWKEDTIEVAEDNTQQIEQKLLIDELDFGLVEGDILSQDLISKPFLKDELLFICAPNHRLSRRTLVEPSELTSEAFIIREKGSGTRKTFEDVMAANGLPFQVSWTCNNADSIRMAVAEGLGIAVISKLAVEQEFASGLLSTFSVRSLEFKRAFKIIYHKNKFLTASMQRFMDACLNGDSTIE